MMSKKAGATANLLATEDPTLYLGAIKIVTDKHNTTIINKVLTCATLSTTLS